MSERDDDDLEGDDKLTAMRTVWLSMRDEEPSDKGLAALMAAAREKADELKEPTPTFWQKVLAAFRRPPVLALASVAILVGGAVIISNRGDKAVAEQTASAPHGEAAPTPAGDETRANAAAGSSASFTAGSGSSAPVENQPAPDTTPAVIVTRPPAEPPKPRPVREKAPGRKVEQEKDSANKSEAPPPPPPPPPPPAPAPEPVADKPTVTPTAPTTRGPQMKPPPAEPTVGGVTSGAGTNTKADAESVSLDGRDEAASAQREEARVLQLVKQCESAAARGDCAAVKALAARIKSQDAATYKARVVKNASIARCLE